MSGNAGIDGKDAALDIPDLRSLLDFICFLRRTAVQTAVHLITTGINCYARDRVPDSN
jgi:hypothetical protein